MSTRPFFSVVLATYNGRMYLAECIESVLAQTLRDFEFIIVDDGSTDGSDELIRTLAARDPERIKVITQGNSGQGAAFNRGVAESRGTLVAFIDSDDFWFPEKLATVAADFGDPEVIALHQHNLRIVRGTTMTDGVFRPTVAIGDVMAGAKESRWLPVFVATSGLTFSRRALDCVGPIPDAFRTCADGFLTRTAMCFGRVSGTDTCCGAYRVHDANQTFNNPGFNTDTYLRELLLPKLNAFYQLRSIPLSFPIRPPPRTSTNGPAATMLRLRAGERVLMIRCAPVDRVARVLASLFAANPGIGVDLLAQPGYEDVFADPRVTTLPLAAGPMTADAISRAVRQTIGRRDYACVVVPYNDPDGSAYANIHAVVLTLPVTCPIVGIGCHGAAYEIERANASLSAEAEGSLFAPLPDWGELRDKYSGTRAFFVGNGAGLRAADFDRLRKEITFASDDVFSLFDRTSWRPTYYTVADPVLASANAARTRRMRELTLLPSTLRALNCAGPRTLWYDERLDNRVFATLSSGERDRARMAFSVDAREGIQSGFTVLYQQLQLAFHMGIREVHLIGAPPPTEELIAGALDSARAVFAKVGGQLVHEPVAGTAP